MNHSSQNTNSELTRSLLYHPVARGRSSINPLTDNSKQEDDMEDFRKAFSLLDRDNNGEITKADLDSFIKNKLGEETTETELQEMITEVSFDGKCLKLFIRLFYITHRYMCRYMGSILKTTSNK